MKLLQLDFYLVINKAYWESNLLCRQIQLNTGDKGVSSWLTTSVAVSKMKIYNCEHSSSLWLLIIILFASYILIYQTQHLFLYACDTKMSNKRTSDNECFTNDTSSSRLRYWSTDNSLQHQRNCWPAFLIACDIKVTPKLTARWLPGRLTVSELSEMVICVTKGMWY